MSLRKHLIASVAMAALAIPAASASFVAFSATPAFAKGGKGGGGKSRGSEDRGSRGKSGKGDAGSGRPGRGGGARAPQGQGNGNGNGKAGAPGQQQPAVALDTAEMRPNELGSMNGALNANINAVLAHIRNGNTNGPVGALAGLAVADHAAADAQDVIDRAAQFDALDAALEDAGYDSLDDYEAAVDAGDINTVQTVEDAKAALDDAAGDEPPTENEIADAEAALAALSDAEAAIFDAWNKSGAATDDQKAALLDALRARLDAESDAIEDALGTTDPVEAPDAGAEDTPDDGSEGDPEGDANPLDPDIQAMLDGLKF